MYGLVYRTTYGRTVGTVGAYQGFLASNSWRGCKLSQLDPLKAHMTDRRLTFQHCPGTVLEYGFSRGREQGQQHLVIGTAPTPT